MSHHENGVVEERLVETGSAKSTVAGKTSNR